MHFTRASGASRLGHHLNRASSNQCSISEGDPLARRFLESLLCSERLLATTHSLKGHNELRAVFHLTVSPRRHCKSNSDGQYGHHSLRMHPTNFSRHHHLEVWATNPRPLQQWQPLKSSSTPSKSAKTSLTIPPACHGDPTLSS